MKTPDFALVAALHKHRNAAAAAREIGVTPNRAWRVAKKHNIKLISLADHMKKRRHDAAFLARQKTAQSAAASAWLKVKHEDEEFHAKSVEAARANITALNAEPAFRKASAERMKRHYDKAPFRKKQAAAAAANMRKQWRDPEFKKRLSTASSKSHAKPAKRSEA